MAKSTIEEKDGEATPEVSVLITVFNERSKNLLKSVESILNQSFSSFELVLIDDGSENKETIEVLKGFDGKEPLICLHREPHRGRYKSLNYGLSICKGEFVCIQDSDDWSEPTRLEKQVKLLKNNLGLGIVGSYFMAHQENENPLWVNKKPLSSNDLSTEYQKGYAVLFGASCFRRSIAEEIGGFYEGFESGMDSDFIWRVLEISEGVNIPEPLYHVRYKQNSITLKNSPKRMELISSIILLLAKMRKDGKKGNVEEMIKELQSSSKIENNTPNSDSILLCGDLNTLAGAYKKAFSIYLQALAAYPFHLRCWLKLARWALFCLIPPARRMLFLGGKDKNPMSLEN